MITFVIILYVIACLLGIVNCIFFEGEGFDLIIRKMLFLPIFIILLGMGVMSFFKLYNIHLTVG